MYRAGSRVRLEITEKGRKTHRPNCGEYSNKDKDNSPNALNDRKFFNILQYSKLFSVLSTKQ